jgi:hypothetical protein
MRTTTAAAVLLSLVSAAQANRNTLSCVDPASVDYTKDYFPDKVTNNFSKLWEITYFNTYKVLKNKSTDKSYAFYQCGTELPAGVAEQHEDTWSVPLQDGIALTATTTIPHLEQLGARRQVKGYLGNPSQISSPCMQTLAQESDGEGSKVLQAVNDPLMASWAQTPDGIPKADFIAANPEVVILKAYGTGNQTLNWNAYEEDGNKATYEWHKVMGALFNLEKLANEQFDASSDRFDCASDNAAYLLSEQSSSTRRLSEPTRALAETDSAAKPTVLWASPAYYGGWDIARCDAAQEYYCEFATACSATLLHANSGTIPVGSYEPDGFHMTLEEFVEFGKDADYWIYSNFLYGDMETALAGDKGWAEISQFKSVKNGNVYDLQKSGTGPWFESRVAEYGKFIFFCMRHTSIQ